MEITKFLSRLQKVKQLGSNQWQALCPAHDDEQQSLSITESEGKILIHCHAGCDPVDIVNDLGLRMSDLFIERGREGVSTPQRTTATVQHHSKAIENTHKKDSSSKTGSCNGATPGCTLEQYSKAKKIPGDFLKDLGLTDITYIKQPAIRIPYLDEGKNETCVQFRLSLDQAPKFKWRRGDKPIPYGLAWLTGNEKFIVIVEGASDCHTLLYNEFPVIGLPGASTWKEPFSLYLAHIPKIYLWVEPDHGGETLQGAITNSTIQDQLYIISSDTWKDPSELYLHDPDNFQKHFNQIIAEATPWVEIREKQNEARVAEAWDKCKKLAGAGNILNKLADKLPAVGIVGEQKLCKITYLALTARLFSKIPSLVIKGPSAAGKSFTIEGVTKFFPESAYYDLTSMSEHALAYDEEPISHRFLIIYEASGLSSDLGTYLIRSLLSEGKIKYKTVVKTSLGMEPLMIERPGPTGLILTTTQIKLHPENETRMINLTVSDSKDQTRAIFKRLAVQSDQDPNLDDWIALQTWLEYGDHEVIIPFAEVLAEMIPPLAVRLRRDFSSFLSLIKAHTLLHRASRLKDSEGRLLATYKDYEVVRDLAGEFVSQGVEALVSDAVKETVQAVNDLDSDTTVTIKEIAKELDLDKSATSRRVRQALDAGYLVNLEDRKGRPLKLKIGDPLPKDIDLLPTVEDLKEKVNGCTVAVMQEGVNTPLPPPSNGADGADSALSDKQGEKSLEDIEEEEFARQEREAIQAANGINN